MLRVRLINRGNHPTFANQPVQVLGICGKNYGQAFWQGEHNGAVFEMSVEDYEVNKFDLIGNTAIGQQWVPQYFEDKTVAKQKLIEWNALVARGRAAGVYKNRMSRKELLAALGEVPCVEPSEFRAA